MTETFENTCKHMMWYNLPDPNDYIHKSDGQTNIGKYRVTVKTGYLF